MRPDFKIRPAVFTTFLCLVLLSPFLPGLPALDPLPAQAVAADLPVNQPSAPPPRKRVEPSPSSHAYGTGVLTEDTTWRGEIFIDGNITIAPQATLAIEPGTTVRFRAGAGNRAGGSLVIQGRISATGSADRPIVFTSEFETAQPSDWSGILLLSSTKNNLLEHCRVEGAVTGLESSFSRGTLKHVGFENCGRGAVLTSSFITITGGGCSNCSVGIVSSDSETTIRESRYTANQTGIRAFSASLSLEGCTFSGNGKTGVEAEKCRIRLVGNGFISNGGGLSLMGCEGSFTANRVVKNTGSGLRLNSSRINISTNEIAFNGGVGIHAEDGGSTAWGNAITGNGGYEVYNAGKDDFTAVMNWWGEKGNLNPAQGIYGRHVNASAGNVRFLPVMSEKPSIVE